MPYAAHFLNAFLLSVVVIDCLRRSPVRLPVARPTERRDHVGLVPLIGGLAMFIAFFMALVLLNPPLQGQLFLLFGLSLLVAVGVVDDFLELRPTVKLILQCGAAALMLFPDGRVLDIGHLFGAEPSSFGFGFLAFPVSLVFVVGMINAVNMIDGVDGLAGSVVAAILLWLAMVAYDLGRQTELAMILLLFFATIGFLVFNIQTPWRERASVFMGDAGSMMLGACLAYFTIMLSTSPGPLSGMVKSASLPALCWLLAVPVIDTLSLIVRRLLAGKSPFAADRRHIHHLLLAAGLSSGQVTALLASIAVLLGGIGFAGVALQIPDTIMALGLLLPVAAHTAFVCRQPASAAKPRTVGTRSDMAAFR